jgi:uncharacterized protein (UPF0332 family)
MTTLPSFYLEKARKLLATARSLIADGYFNDGARGAYLAAYNAAQAYIADHAGRAAKTHRGVHTQFAQLAMLEAAIDAEMRGFLTEAYDLKAIADYEFGENADIPPKRATAAVDKAGRFVECITDLLQGSPR